MDGKKASMPRYYKDKIYSESQRKFIAYHVKTKINNERENAISKDENFFAKSASEAEAAFTKMAYRSKQGHQTI